MTERAELGNSFGNYLLHGIDEVIVPESISLIPQTIGWKIVGVLLIAYILWRSFLAWRLWQKNWYRREGLQVLAKIKTSLLNLFELFTGFSSKTSEQLLVQVPSSPLIIS